MRLSVKINLLFTIIVSGILLGIAFLVLNLSAGSVHKDFRERLRTRAARAAYLYNLFRSDTTNLLKSLDANAPPALYNKSIWIFDTSLAQRYVYHDDSTKNLLPDSSQLLARPEQGDSYYERAGRKGIVYYDTMIARNIFTIVEAENVAGKTYLADLKRIVIIYFPLALVITLIAGYLFSRSIVKPIQGTIRDVELITSQNLSHRLYVGNRGDELARLNITFNDLLDRLEESFSTEKRFIANASHELSTPLTAVSSQIQVGLMHQRTPAEYQQILRSILEDIDGLNQLTRNLLEIARAGNPGGIELSRLRIDELVLRVYTDVLKLDQRYNITLNIPELPEDERECMVFGNPYLLHSAIRNLAQNGCKYSPDHHVIITVMFSGEELQIVFQNKSSFNTPDDFEKLFEPFYRGSNSESEGGVGLGLTLANRIIRLHKGSITIQLSEEGLLTFSVLLPSLKK